MLFCFRSLQEVNITSFARVSWSNFFVFDMYFMRAADVLVGGRFPRFGGINFLSPK